jgi:hypothetical protein
MAKALEISVKYCDVYFLEQTDSLSYTSECIQAGMYVNSINNRRTSIYAQTQTYNERLGNESAFFHLRIPGGSAPARLHGEKYLLDARKR